MKNQDVEKKLNNAESKLMELDNLADQLKSNQEFGAEFSNLEKMKQLAQEAKMEVADAKSKNK
ncbi:hypothetical protein [Phosphitispora sp. TUW77]|uniref:hypothetical protein n=1 Tax=Phosphitispora sp. TUW77 TaxID=3152361 RepID=UPI003AB5A5DF